MFVQLQLAIAKGTIAAERKQIKKNSDISSVDSILSYQQESTKKKIHELHEQREIETKRTEKERRMGRSVATRCPGQRRTGRGGSRGCEWPWTSCECYRAWRAPASRSRASWSSLSLSARSGGELSLIRHVQLVSGGGENEIKGSGQEERTRGRGGDLGFPQVLPIPFRSNCRPPIFLYAHSMSGASDLARREGWKKGSELVENGVKI